MSFKFYPLKALLVAILLLGIEAGVQAQAVLEFNKFVANYSTGGNGATANPNEILTYTITIKNVTSQNFVAAKLYDNVPPGVTYITGSTTLNGAAVADKIVNSAPTMPYSGTGWAVNSDNFTAGILAPNTTATVTFQVKVSANGGSIFNNATIDATQGGTSTILATNTVYTNVVLDAGCNIVYQTTSYYPDPNQGDNSGQPTLDRWSFLRQVNTNTSDAIPDGSGGTFSSPMYNGITGTAKRALPVGSNTNTGQILDHCAAIAYDRVRQRIYFINNDESQDLGYIDIKNYPSSILARSYVGKKLETQTSSDNGYRINRMGMGSDGYVYALTSNGKDLIRFTFDAGDNPIVDPLGPLVNAPTNGSKNVLASSESGGDLFADGSGKLYLITNASSMWKINPATRVATYMGKMKVNGVASSLTSQSLAIDALGNVYIGGAYRDVYKLDLQTMNAVKLNSSQTNVYNSGDFTTCGFPVLASSIIADKTYKDIDGDGIINGGDTVEYIITVTNIGNINAAGVYMYDYIPPSTTYIPGTTKLNGIAVADVSGKMPYAVTGNPNGKLVNSPGEDPGIVLPLGSNSAKVTFRVKTEPNKQVCNQSKISLLDADGNVMFVNSSDPTNVGQTPTCFYSDGVLPLINLKFKGTMQEQKSVLNWTMDGDEGVATYDVEYSENGTLFTKAGTVAAKGNSNITNSYQFTDADHTFSTTRWYRLKVNQKGGNTNYSGVIRLTTESTIEAVPNPFEKDINVTIQSKNAEQVRIRLIDFSGREVYSTTEKLSIGSNSISVRFPTSLIKGMYMLDIRSAGNNQSIFQKKLLKN